jgi:rare lipoprotein A (peptidoglycan hydrolase)
MNWRALRLGAAIALGTVLLFDGAPPGFDGQSAMAATRGGAHTVQVGRASWYGPGLHGRRTASGERFDQHAFSAAHRSLKLNSIIRVTNLANGRSVVLRVNDRGPARADRILDVSKRAANRLGFVEKGTTRVRIEVLATGPE